MVTQLKAKDVPQPWHSSKKKTNGIPRPQSSASKVSATEDLGVPKMHVDLKRRGRSNDKPYSKSTSGQKGMKKTRPLPASAMNILLGVSATSIADVEELRRKRKQDAEASGRTVRTISPIPRRKSPTKVKGSSMIEDENDNSVATNVFQAPTSPLLSSEGAPSSDENVGGKKGDNTILEEAEEVRDLIPSRRAGKEPVEEYVDDVNPYYERKYGCRTPLRGNVPNDTDSDSRHRSPGGQGGRQCLLPSPSKKNLGDPYEVARTESRDDRQRSYQERIVKDSPSRSPRRRRSFNRQAPQSWSPTRSDSRSPIRWRGGRSDNTGRHFRDFDEYHFSPRVQEDYRHYRGFNYRDHRRHREYESSSPENTRRQQRSRSREDGRPTQERKKVPYYSMSPPRRSINSVDAKSKEWVDSIPIIKENLSPTSDRRRRRHEQAFVEAEATKRQNEGNKPFYLTLDPEGRPYGSGRPAWIAEINKLARGLDPSCTDIRKQTFEVVQTLKDRLNEKFDYSGRLNEDFLRALMGRAVTKRRGELIAFIKKPGSKRPHHMDYGIWCRLENLANSKQREEKSKQGRHANACRRVVGRTGRRGIDGVREKLRSYLGRSPDPSEVEEEMQRDKGYGGRKRKQPVYNVEEETNSAEVIYVAEDNDQRIMRRASRDLCDVEFDEALHQEAGSTIEKEEQHSEHGVADYNISTGMTSGAQRIFTGVQETVITKDDYIEKLEAKIKLLEEGKSKVLTTNVHTTSTQIMS